MTLGQIDYHLFTPWQPAELWLYPPVSEFLTNWSKTQEPSFVAIRIVGRGWEPRSHQLRDILTRVAMPYGFYAHDSEAGRRILEEAGQDDGRLPVVVFRTGDVLVDPSHAELSEFLGASTRPEPTTYDVAIVGAGPAGLAAAVSAASEGLRTLVVEPEVFGGQAGTSSLIRNYPGFPYGISGDDLAFRTFEQAWLFGTCFVFVQAATGSTARGSERLLRLSDGRQVTASAVILAPGVSWRRLGVPSLEALAGAGVFYGAAGSEVHAMQGQQVFVVGAGSSARQAALHLAEHAGSVTVLVRGGALGTTMSDYLAKKIHATPQHLRSAAHRGHRRAAQRVLGASRCTTAATTSPRPWPLARPPLFLETSLPGVFAAGDVRHRSIKRVASAVGEGAIAVQLVHEYLAEQPS
jgi:thioredoxin reductase (NADPH)